jgi:hypothetical protein
MYFHLCIATLTTLLKPIDQRNTVDVAIQNRANASETSRLQAANGSNTRSPFYFRVLVRRGTIANTSQERKSSSLLRYTEHLTRSPRLLKHLHKGLESLCVVGVPCLDSTPSSDLMGPPLQKPSVKLIAQDRECEDLAIMITDEVFRPLTAGGALPNPLCDPGVGRLENAL